MPLLPPNQQRRSTEGQQLMTDTQSQIHTQSCHKHSNRHTVTDTQRVKGPESGADEVDIRTPAVRNMLRC